MTRKVRANSLYRHDPVGYDRVDPKTTLSKGDVCRVVNKYGCPRANTMGHCHVETVDGDFLGLVHCNSLENIR